MQHHFEVTQSFLRNVPYDHHRLHGFTLTAIFAKPCVASCYNTPTAICLWRRGSTPTVTYYRESCRWYAWRFLWVSVLMFVRASEADEPVPRFLAGRFAGGREPCGAAGSLVGHGQHRLEDRYRRAGLVVPDRLEGSRLSRHVHQHLEVYRSRGRASISKTSMPPSTRATKASICGRPLCLDLATGKIVWEQTASEECRPSRTTSRTRWPRKRRRQTASDST